MMRAPASILPLEVQDLRFEASGQSLLSGVSFTLPPGGVTVILGPNGAGKSLLLRLCHGLLTPAGGEIHWRGISDARRHAMVFQKPVMLRRSALDNVAHALRAQGAGRGEAGERAQAILTRFGLGAISRRRARLLSGGEQQRLAIARAAALRPDLLFLDEPCSQLDPGATRQIEEMLGAMRAEGMTLVMTTHDMGQARRLADRVMFLHRGRLVEDTPAPDFFAGPESAEARAFLSGDLLW